MKGLNRIDAHRLEVPLGYRRDMRVPGIIYASSQLEKELEESAIAQVANVATLPGIVSASMAMPDIHTGYGFTIGGVAAFDFKDGVISPGGVGYDINCGVRLLSSDLTKNDVLPKMGELLDALYSAIPVGVGATGCLRLTAREQKRLLKKGAAWAVEAGFGEPEDLERTESGGVLSRADPSVVSPKALERGSAQQATLGGGNHFLEIQVVDRIFDPVAARDFGLFEEQAVIMIHTGSRGFGHQVCSDALKMMAPQAAKYGLKIVDRELVSAPANSPEAQDYLGAMSAAANYAWANRQCITHRTREAFGRIFHMSLRELGLHLVYDVAHNIAKVETHMLDGRKTRLIVHRKGATRAFPPEHPELPEEYRQVGQPVLIPGDMGRASYVLRGTEKAMMKTFGSTCHGAGRRLSRNQARKQARGRSIGRELEERGIMARAKGKQTLAEEMSEAYKDIDQVVAVVDRAGLSRKVARLLPLGVIKG